jgi:hypothetical protein
VAAARSQVCCRDYCAHDLPAGGWLHVVDGQWQHQRRCPEFVGERAVAATSKLTDDGWWRGLQRGAAAKLQATAIGGARAHKLGDIDLNALFRAAEIIFCRPKAVASPQVQNGRACANLRDCTAAALRSGPISACSCPNTTSAAKVLAFAVGGSHGLHTLRTPRCRCGRTGRSTPAPRDPEEPIITRRLQTLAGSRPTSPSCPICWRHQGQDSEVMRPTL